MIPNHLTVISIVIYEPNFSKIEKDNQILLTNSYY